MKEDALLMGASTDLVKDGIDLVTRQMRKKSRTLADFLIFHGKRNGKNGCKLTPVNGHQHRVRGT